MKIILNGNEREVTAAVSLAQLVEQLGMNVNRVAAELNRQIVSRELWSETILRDGDRLELVHFVGGGSREHNEQPAPSVAIQQSQVTL
jgi:thiamine biosynthesis protein ThiS